MTVNRAAGLLTLSVLRGTNYYMIAAHVDGDNVAIDKQIALAVV